MPSPEGSAPTEQASAAAIEEAERRLVGEQARSEAASPDWQERIDTARARFNQDRRDLQEETARLLRETETQGRDCEAALQQAETACREKSQLQAEIARLIEEADQARPRADLTGRRDDEWTEQVRKLQASLGQPGRDRELELRDGQSLIETIRRQYDLDRAALREEVERIGLQASASRQEAEALTRERDDLAARRDEVETALRMAERRHGDQARRQADSAARRDDELGDQIRALREELERQHRDREAEPQEDRRRLAAVGGETGSDPAHGPVSPSHPSQPATSHSGTIPPARRPDLLLRPIGDEGRHVVKDLRTGGFFELGPVESFLLLSLDGRQPTESIRAAYEGRFAEPLSPEDLEDFLELARGQGFLTPEGEPTSTTAGEADAEQGQGQSSGARDSRPLADGPVPGPSRSRQSLLYWRKTLFDPDRLFNFLEPRLRFLWTRGFLAGSGGLILAAAWLVWTERQALVTQFPHALRWETLALAWVTMVTVTTLHEFAHGLTCKRYGGEVHEVGFLLMYGLPCFFCNVSDAWLFRERWKRLWVTIAGGYCDLVLWAVAVFAWRVTLPDSLPNYVAWVVLSICGIRVLFNFNPLLKLDGYYILSDWLEMPNLRKRAWDAWMGHLRWALWGGPRPGLQPRGRFLLGFGMASWLYALFFTALVLAGLRGLLSGRGGALGIAWMTALGLAMVRGQFDGFTAGEFGKMIRSRRKRAVSWAMAVVALSIVLSTARMDERVGGAFTVRPTRRAEIRARIAGFLREIDFDEGDRVSPGISLARLEVPDLESRIAQKRAQVEEAEAKLRLLQVGPRPEEVEEQRARVKRAEAWLELGRRDLKQAHRAFEEELMQLNEELTRARVEQDAAAAGLARARKLADRGAESREQLREAETKWRVAQAQLRQSEARKRAREASGTQEAEAELSLREQKLAEARAALALLEMGARPEEIEAERARLALLQEEARYLEGLVGRVEVTSPVGGLVATPRLKEKVGQYLREGDLICEIESPDALEYEVVVAEQDEARIRPGQPVVLKARALPYETFRARVGRIAPRASKAEKAEVQATFVVYCDLDDRGTGLRPGMTGHARIACGRKLIGEILLNSMLRVIRTEFWW